VAKVLGLLRRIYVDVMAGSDICVFGNNLNAHALYELGDEDSAVGGNLPVLIRWSKCFNSKNYCLKYV